MRGYAARRLGGDEGVLVCLPCTRPFRVVALGFRVQDSGVRDSESRVEGHLALRAAHTGLGFGVWGLGLGVQGLVCAAEKAVSDAAAAGAQVHAGVRVPQRGQRALGARQPHPARHEAVDPWVES